MDTNKLLSRGIAEVLPSKEGLAKIMKKRKIRLYQGFDPTGTQLHIGHAVALRKLRQFQDLGHEVIFLIGDGTGQAGDPSGKSKTRERFMTREELQANARDYVMQAGKIVRFDGPNPVKILYNGDWLNKLKLVDILNIAQNFSVQQMIERDMFQDRIKKSESINLREFLYPLLQGYDSVAMEVDLEVGGTDQTFNMLAGRTLVKSFLNKEKFVLTVPLLSDSKGVKIGKSEGNVIGLTDPPSEFYAKVMSLGDDAIVPCLTLLTDIPISEIDKVKTSLKKGNSPMEHKKHLAFILTEQFNSRKDAQIAQEDFEKKFQKKSTDVYQDFKITKRDLLGHVVSRAAQVSMSQAKRWIGDGAVDIDGVPASDPRMILKNNQNIKIGKKIFIKVKSK